MIRLPPTGIGISQNDSIFHLQQLDIYQGLLKQGFKKKEIIRYFNEQKAREQPSGPSDPLSSGSQVAPSTYDLCRNTFTDDPDTSPPSKFGLVSKPAERISSSPDPLASCLDTNISASNGRDYGVAHQTRNHAPRQSSLLRFAHRPSLDSSPEEEKALNLAWSPRSITYRPRSQTYSYDQSEMDEEDLPDTKTAVVAFEHLSLDDELVPSHDSAKTAVRVPSSLRPEAKEFTPLLAKVMQPVQALDEGNSSGSDSSSDSIPSPSAMSFPSSPPMPTVSVPPVIIHRSPSLPPIPRSHQPQTPAPNTALRFTRPQYDGTSAFRVYHDRLPTRFQPQTPADLASGSQFNEHNAAYTAPPGMVRSSASHQGHWANSLRNPSGGQSPTRHAMLLRERRQREFVRGAQVEELRIGRATLVDHGQHRMGTADVGPGAQEIPTEATRSLFIENLEADRVGEENFGDVPLEDRFRDLLRSLDVDDLAIGPRSVSGNRRAI